MTSTIESTNESLAAARIDSLLAEEHQRVRARTDRLFAGLMTIQWLAGVFASLLIAPGGWGGAANGVDRSVWVAFLGGALIAAAPITLALTRPGRRSTGHVIAFGQMLTSIFLIHMSGGRMETHFHVFCSLALLAFYRDTRVLLTASLVVVLDHIVRGSLATLGARRAAAAAEHVETLAEQGDLAAAAAAIEALEREIARARPGIERLGDGELRAAA